MNLVILRETQRGPIALMDLETQGRAVRRTFSNVKEAFPEICLLFAESYNAKEDLAEADRRIVELEKQHEHDLQVIDLLEADKEELKEKVQKLLQELEGAQ